VSTEPFFDDAEKMCWRLREEGQLDEIPKEQDPRLNA
jgi:hypothetical protein